MMPKKLFAAFASCCLSIVINAQNNIFTSFEVQPGAGCSVFIQWTADPKSDTLDFVVERSADKKVWKTTNLKIPSSSHKYSSFDNVPEQGYNYYRVRQAGRSDSLSVTSIKWIDLNRNNEIFIWQNQLQEEFYVKTLFFSGVIDIINPAGKLILSVSITGFITTVTTVPLEKGTYLLRIKYGSQEIAEKFIME